MDFPVRVTYAIIVGAYGATGNARLMTQTASAMVSNEPARIFVHLLPGLIPPGCLRGGVAIVVDVLRASTVIVYALAAGCSAVIPCAEIEEAKAKVASLPRGSALLAGERKGLAILGFDLGNSPGEMTRETCKGKTLVMTTTNGTRAILASLDAERVYVASFANLRATTDEISVQFLKKDHRHPIHIICAGTDGRISLEDSLLAGALASNAADVSEFIPGSRVATLFGNDEALMVVCQWLEVERYLQKRSLSALLALGRGGQSVGRVGLDADIEAASLFNLFPLVAELCRDPVRIVAV
jgi:2-phosphosulfolactate phosphatase